MFWSTQQLLSKTRKVKKKAFSCAHCQEFERPFKKYILSSCIAWIKGKLFITFSFLFIVFSSFWYIKSTFLNFCFHLVRLSVCFVCFLGFIVNVVSEVLCCVHVVINLFVHFSDIQIHWHMPVLVLKNKAYCAQHQSVSITGPKCEQGDTGLCWLWPAVTRSLHFFFTCPEYLPVSRMWWFPNVSEVGNCCLRKGTRQAGPHMINYSTGNHHIGFQTYLVHWNKSALHKANIADTAEHNYINLLLLSSQFPKSFQGVEIAFFFFFF